MKYKTLKNVSDKDIDGYPIAEAEFNSNGELIIDNNNNYKTTGQTLKWTIKVGETLKIPSYVADILLDRFGVEDKSSGVCILKEVPMPEEPKTEVESDSKTEVEPVTDRGFICKKCGKSYISSKGLALHISAMHPELLK